MESLIRTKIVINLFYLLDTDGDLVLDCYTELCDLLETRIIHVYKPDSVIGL